MEKQQLQQNDFFKKVMQKLLMQRKSQQGIMEEIE